MARYRFVIAGWLEAEDIAYAKTLVNHMNVEILLGDDVDYEFEIVEGPTLLGKGASVNGSGEKAEGKE